MAESFDKLALKVRENKIIELNRVIDSLVMRLAEALASMEGNQTRAKVAEQALDVYKNVVSAAIQWQDADNYVTQYGNTGPEGQPVADARYTLHNALDHLRVTAYLKQTEQEATSD